MNRKKSLYAIMVERAMSDQRTDRVNFSPGNNVFQDHHTGDVFICINDLLWELGYTEEEISEPGAFAATEVDGKGYIIPAAVNERMEEWKAAANKPNWSEFCDTAAGRRIFFAGNLYHRCQPEERLAIVAEVLAKMDKDLVRQFLAAQLEALTPRGGADGST